MTKWSKFIGAAAVTAVIALTSTASEALPIYTSGSFATVATTGVTTNLATTTSFILTSFAGGYEDGSSPSGDMLLASGSWSPRILVSTPTTIDFTSASTFNWGADTPTLGSFAGSTVTFLGSTDDGLGHVTFSYAVDGLFTLGTDWANAGSSLTARETWSLTQTAGAGHSISISGTFQAPASTKVPEPITLSLFGAGLAGAAALRRRRKNQKVA